jgi:hypothetical protein
MIYFILALAATSAIILWLSFRKTGKSKKKKNCFSPDFSRMTFTGRKCECF